MANQFNWALGHEGKGNVYDDGSISTWRTDETRSPHHYEIGQQDEKVPRFHFYLSPEGGLWDGGTTFNNQTSMPDDQVVKNVVEKHPAVWDGRNEIFEDYGDEGAYEPEDRVEMPGGGFGHADALMQMRSKLASSGWADFHTEYKLPRATRKQLRRWVDRLKWPENHTKHDAREYHITVLDLDTYDEDFAKWARRETQGKKLTFKSTGMEMFNDFIVVRLDCPEWDDLATRWTEEAEKRGLDPHKFPGGPKAHVSVGQSHDKKWPKGVPNPHIKFHTQMFNIKRNAMAVDPQFLNQWAEADPYLYHGRQEHPDTVRYNGIEGSFANYHPTPSVYMTEHPDLAEHFAVNPGVNPEWPEENHPGSWVYKIDTRKLDPKLLEPDEWNVNDYPEGHEYHGDGFDMSQETRNHLEDPQVAQRQLEMGYPMAYRSPVPPEAIVDHWPVEWDGPGAAPQGKGAHVIANAPDDDLKLWLDSFAPQEQQTALSPYHVNETQFKPYTKAPVVQTPHIDPPKKPYQPYNWAEEGWEESPMDRVGTYEVDGMIPCPNCGHMLAETPCSACGYDDQHTSNTHHCPQCDAMIDGQICGNCGYDPFSADSDYEKAKNEWYDRAWSHPGDQPLEVPNQPMHWGPKDNAADISVALSTVSKWHESDRPSTSVENRWHYLR